MLKNLTILFLMVLAGSILFKEREQNKLLNQLTDAHNELAENHAKLIEKDDLFQKEVVTLERQHAVMWKNQADIDKNLQQRLADTLSEVVRLQNQARARELFPYNPTGNGFDTSVVQPWDPKTLEGYKPGSSEGYLSLVLPESPRLTPGAVTFWYYRSVAAAGLLPANFGFPKDGFAPGFTVKGPAGMLVVDKERNIITVDPPIMLALPASYHKAGGSTDAQGRFSPLQ